MGVRHAPERTVTARMSKPRRYEVATELAMLLEPADFLQGVCAALKDLQLACQVQHSEAVQLSTALSLSTGCRAWLPSGLLSQFTVSSEKRYLKAAYLCRLRWLAHWAEYGTSLNRQTYAKWYLPRQTQP
jgi:hypothetical protein